MALSDTAISRLLVELTNMTKEPDENVRVVFWDMIENRVETLTVTIAGPAGSVYKDADFLLDVKLPENYPQRPPNLRFLTKIWHPNICPVTGRLYPGFYSTWCECMTIKTLLGSARGLLSSPLLGDSANAILAYQFVSNRDQFDLTARYWLHVYANATSTAYTEMDSKVAQLIETGCCDETSARDALAFAEWDIERAFENLCGSPQLEDLDQELAIQQAIAFKDNLGDTLSSIMKCLCTVKRKS
ncbi:ubiquitin-conjugating enzyme E2-22 kDa-like [Paramacrobiotus metropolitanus]|uniref:ubiquitin-conjugating enzyme E2-22 kDa-like n=1 Tax=Paramacrobiotus metropolitanus TaxID=2943436 RepID=UPI00244568B3|nr:ubiquitin-conjugating enzyme E2-22 kDa-like [Paramacrobiotus metropolitanus]